MTFSKRLNDPKSRYSSHPESAPLGARQGGGGEIFGVRCVSVAIFDYFCSLIITT